MLKNLEERMVVFMIAALLTVGGLVGQANAATITAGGSGVLLAATGTTGAASNDTLVMAGNNISVNDGLSDAVTGLIIQTTTGDYTVTTDGNNADVNNTIGSFTGTGSGNFIVNALDDDNSATVTVTVTGGLATGTGGVVTLTSTETDGSDGNIIMSVGGDYAATGLTSLIGANHASAVVGLSLAGATNTGAVLLNDGASGSANGHTTLTLAAAVAQTFAGSVTGGADGEGDLVVNNSHASGATFTGIIGGDSLNAHDKELDNIKVGMTNADSTAIFQNSVATALMTVGDGSNTNDHIVTFEAQAANITMKIDQLEKGATDTGTINFLDATADTAANVITYTGAIGTTVAQTTVNVGSATQAGSATFSGVVKSATVNVIGGDHANEDSLANITGVVTATNVNLTGGTAGDATLIIGASTYVATNTTLDDATSGGSAILQFAATGASAVVLKGASDGEGTVKIDNSTGSTFSGIIGNNGANSLKEIIIGSTGASAAKGIFDNAVSATNITLGDGANTDTITVTFEAQTAVHTVDALIDGTAGDTAVMNVVDVTASTVAEAITFTKAIGATSVVETINVGAADLGGYGIFDGNVTATTINVLGGDDNAEKNVADFNADVTAAIVLNNVDANKTATVHYSGTVAQTQTGLITAASTAEGGLVVNNPAGVTFANHVGDTGGNSLLTFTNQASSKATFNGELSADTVTLAASSETIITQDNNDVAAFVPQNDSILTLASTVLATQTVFTTVASVTDATAGRVTLNLPSNFTTGTITLYDANTLIADVNSFANPDTALIDYTIQLNGAATEVTAAAKTAAATATELGITEASAEGLASSVTAAAGDVAILDLISSTLNAGGAAATELAEQVQGSPDGLSAASGAATASTGGAVMSVGSSRMAALRTGNAYASTLGTGFNAGSGSQSNSMWMKPFASFGDQGVRKGIAGYDSDTYGIAVGADTRINAHSVVGLSFSYADTDVDGKGAGRSRTDISSYQLTAYADYTEKNWYFEGLVGYAYNDMDSTRTITATSATATGTTESNQFMVNINAGMPHQIEPGTYFTPSVGLNVTHVTNQDYTETGAGALNLRVNPEDITIAKLSLGGRLHTSVRSPEGTFTPELRARVLYDMAGDDGSSTNTFTGGGAAFNVKGLDVVEFSSSVGIGMAYTPAFDTGMNLSVNYDAELKQTFTGHAANFTLKYAF